MFNLQAGSVFKVFIVTILSLTVLLHSQCKKDPLDDLNCRVDIVSFSSEIQAFYPGTDLTGLLTVSEDLEDIGDAEIRQMISIYFSEDALYNDTDTEIQYIRGSLTVDPDNENRSIMEWNLTMPFGLEAGNYYLLARIQNQTWVCGTNGDDSVWVLPETSSMPITILE